MAARLGRIGVLICRGDFLQRQQDGRGVLARSRNSRSPCRPGDFPSLSLRFQEALKDIRDSVPDNLGGLPPPLAIPRPMSYSGSRHLPLIGAPHAVPQSSRLPRLLHRSRGGHRSCLRACFGGASLRSGSAMWSISAMVDRRPKRPVPPDSPDCRQASRGR